MNLPLSNPSGSKIRFPKLWPRMKKSIGDKYKCIGKFIDNHIDKVGARFILLAACGVISIVAFACFREEFYCLLGVLFCNADGELIPIPAVDGILLSLLVLLVLWWFRTRDIHRQIEKQDAQIQQGNFVSGLNKVVANKSMTVSVGVKILMSVSNKTNEFDDEIRLAFIKRLQHLPNDIRHHDGQKIQSDRLSLSIRLPTLNYMPNIFGWLIEHAKRNDIDIERESINVPEMYFEIKELKSTERFLDFGGVDFAKRSPKRIPLHEIKAALKEYHILQNTEEKSVEPLFTSTKN